MKTRTSPASSAAFLLLALLGALLVIPPAQAGEFSNAFELGTAHAAYPVDSDDLEGPPGTTPPGITAKVGDKMVWPLIYHRQFSDA